MERKVSTTELKRGMYVAHLDRPWIESHFLFQGFHIRSDADVRELQKLCSYVVIDIARGVPADHYLDDTPTAPTLPGDPPAAEHPAERYPIRHAVDREMPKARAAFAGAARAVHDLMNSVRSSKKISVEGVKKSVEPLIQSALRNPDALIWLTRLKQAGDYHYQHSLNASVIGVTFGRHLGLDSGDLMDLAIGCMMFDVGKMRCAPDLLNKSGRLTPEERAEIQKHVDYSVQILKETPGISENVVLIARTHHERHNGEGYPRRLRGTRIPLLGRIAAIVDCYDAITSARPYAPAMGPHRAVLQIYEWRGVDFQEELVEQFVQCLGVYPTGSLIELSTGEVGAILSQNRYRRLRPKIMLILDADKSPLGAHPVIDLATETVDARGRPLEIRELLPHDAYGIDPRKFFL